MGYRCPTGRDTIEGNMTRQRYGLLSNYFGHIIIIVIETLDGIRRVQSIKILGTTFTNGLSITAHVQQL